MEAATSGQPPQYADEHEYADEHASSSDTFNQHPEIFVGAAFAGGLAAAVLIRVLGPSE